MWKEVDNVVVKGGPGKESLVTTPVRTKIKRWEIVAGKAGKVVRSGGKTTQKQGNKSEGRKKGRQKDGGAPTTSPTTQQKISKYITKCKKAAETSPTQGSMGSPDSIGGRKGKEEGNQNYYKTAGV